VGGSGVHGNATACSSDEHGGSRAVYVRLLAPKSGHDDPTHCAYVVLHCGVLADLSQVSFFFLSQSLTFSFVCYVFRFLPLCS
jgi:hypothetical protein